MAGKCKFQVGDIIIIVDHGANRFQDGDMGTLVKYVDRPWWPEKGWVVDFSAHHGNVCHDNIFCYERRIRMATNQEIQERSKLP